MPDVGAVYAEGRARVTELLAGVDAAAVPVPACPGWSVKDVAAHLSGVCADILAGNLEGVTTHEWTSAQVSPRREWSVAEIIDEWASAAPQVERIAETFGPAGYQWVTDAVTHEHDVRGALDAPGARDSDGVAMGVEFMITVLDGDLRRRGLPAVRVRGSAREWIVGEGARGVTLDVDDFTLLRACTGRRSRHQLRALGWGGDPTPYLDVFELGPFVPPATDLLE